jgi:alkanesulfonate monooxygenase SsuD/methylene tetrahydromethanopterin reductase-like flavin-dependent oxidoreductase (luciferase family)
MWVCAGYAGWAPKATGRRGWAFCTTGDLEGGGSIFDLYADAAQTAGHDPSTLRRGLFRDVMVMESEHEAVALAEEDYWPFFNDQVLGFGFMDFKNPDGSQMTELPEAMKKGVLVNTRNPVGRPGKVAEMLQPVLEMDLDLFLVRLAWANFKHERALRTLETFAREVIPMLRNGRGT